MPLCVTRVWGLVPTRPKELLSPREGNIIQYKNSDKPPQTIYGLILEILRKNQVTVKTQLFGKATDLPIHISTLSLLFRPTEWSNYGTPVITKADCPLEKRVEELCDLKIVPQAAQWNEQMTKKGVFCTPNLFYFGKDIEFRFASVWKRRYNVHPH